MIDGVGPDETLVVRTVGELGFTGVADLSDWLRAVKRYGYDYRPLPVDQQFKILFRDKPWLVEEAAERFSAENYMPSHACMYVFEAQGPEGERIPFILDREGLESATELGIDPNTRAVLVAKKHSGGMAPWLN